jgi:hypothetical protein
VVRVQELFASVRILGVLRVGNRGFGIRWACGDGIGTWEAALGQSEAGFGG